MNLIIFIFNIISLLDLWEFYIMQTNSAPLSVCSDPPLMPAVTPTKENLKKNQDKINKRRNKKKKNTTSKHPLGSSIFPISPTLFHPDESGA